MIVLLNVASILIDTFSFSGYLSFLILVLKPRILAGFFYSFPQSLQEDAKIVPEIITPPLASLFFTIYYFFFILLLT